MRKVIIDVYKASQDDRIKLHNHLRALGENVYGDTGLKNKIYDCSRFEYDSSSNLWSGCGHSRDLSAISITDFINKFIKPVTVIPEPIKHQYKPGDSVKIRSDLKQGYDYTVYVNETMVELAGKIVKIDSDSKRVKDGKTIWKIKKDSFDWTDDLFEPISDIETPEKEPEMDIKVGDVYKNSSGNLNTITRVIRKDLIYYTVSTGREYSTHLNLIKRNWKKVLQVDVAQPTTVPIYLARRTIKVGDYVERTKQRSNYNDLTPAFVKEVSYKNISLVGSTKGYWDMENFQIINPEHPSHPNYQKSLTKTLTGFKPGDRVKVRADLQDKKTYKMLSGKLYTDSAINSMVRFAGKIVTIEKHETDVNRYLIEEQSSFWVDEMFDGLESEQAPIPQTPIAPLQPAQTFKIGDKVKLKDNLENGKSYRGATFYEGYREQFKTGIVRDISGTAYLIDDLWYGVDALELDTSTAKYPIGFEVELSGTFPKTLRVVQTKASKAGDSIYNLQYVDNGKYTGFVSESFITNEIDLTKTKAAMKVNAVRGTSSTTTVSTSSKIALATISVTGTPLGGTNQQTLKSEKKTMAQKIKDTAMVTLDQNKQAAIIAGKMEAGRILNKQVIKQIKPHLPFFVQGYLATPLAPVVVANLVAAVGNHTQNRRVQQVSELMLLAAADATVQSFNLDKIIDDVLAGVKLPAGILDTDEE